jgi:hypothetical protein
VFNCSYCGISLCVDCFVLFHTLSREALYEKKEELKGSMVAKRAAKSINNLANKKY